MNEDFVKLFRNFEGELLEPYLILEKCMLVTAPTDLKISGHNPNIGTNTDVASVIDTHKAKIIEMGPYAAIGIGLVPLMAMSGVLALTVSGFEKALKGVKSPNPEKLDDAENLISYLKARQRLLNNIVELITPGSKAMIELKAGKPGVFSNMLCENMVAFVEYDAKKVMEQFQNTEPTTTFLSDLVTHLSEQNAKLLQEIDAALAKNKIPFLNHRPTSLLGAVWKFVKSIFRLG